MSYDGSVPTACLYFHVHQPIRLRRYSLFRQRGKGTIEEECFDFGLNRAYLDRAAQKCYLKANASLLNSIKAGSGNFKISYSITGVFLDQCARWNPAVLDSFGKLADSGGVDFLEETYFHSLAGLWGDKQEFREQVKMHREAVWETFGCRPSVFRNTELLYNNALAQEVHRLGYEGILSEGIERVLGWRSPNYVYRARGCGIKLLLRNYRLSDDVGYRFSARYWNEWPLTADKFASWLRSAGGKTVNLFLDYETFGEHHWDDTGIFQFLDWLPRHAADAGMRFLTAAETVRAYDSVDEVDVAGTVSWADLERDESAWLGNRLQHNAFEELRKVGERARLAGGEALRVWRLFTTSDHFMYMCTKGWADGDVHKHFSPYKDWGPYDNYINFMNALHDLSVSIDERLSANKAAEAGEPEVSVMPQGVLQG